MSAIGFSPGTPNELDQLREAYRSLSDITRNLAGAQRCFAAYIIETRHPDLLKKRSPVRRRPRK